MIHDFPGGSNGKSVCLQSGRPRFDPWVGKISWRRKWQPIPVFLPGKSHGWRSLEVYSPWGHKELDTTEWLHCHFMIHTKACVTKSKLALLTAQEVSESRDKVLKQGIWLYSQSQLTKKMADKHLKITILLGSECPVILWIRDVEKQSKRTI